MNCLFDKPGTEWLCFSFVEFLLGCEEICKFLNPGEFSRWKQSHRRFQNVLMPRSMIYGALARFHHENCCRKRKFGPNSCLGHCRNVPSGIKKGHLVQFLQAQGFAKETLDFTVHEGVCADPFQFKFLAHLRNSFVNSSHADYPDLFIKSVLNFVHGDEAEHRGKRRRQTPREARLRVLLECSLPRPVDVVPERVLAEALNVALEACDLVEFCKFPVTCCQCENFRLNKKRHVKCAVTEDIMAPIVSGLLK